MKVILLMCLSTLFNSINRSYIFSNRLLHYLFAYRIEANKKHNLFLLINDDYL